jgi:hypothetical protein
MQNAARDAQPPASLSRICPASFPSRSMRLEDVVPEETIIRELERQISEARRNDTPTDSLIERRRRTYESWIERLDRDIKQPPRGQDPGKLRQQRQRAITHYRWPDPPPQKVQ